MAYTPWRRHGRPCWIGTGIGFALVTIFKIKYEKAKMRKPPLADAVFLLDGRLKAGMTNAEFGAFAGMTGK